MTDAMITVNVGKDPRHPDTSYTVAVDKIAAQRDGQLFLLAVVGPANDIKGLRAALSPTVGASFTLSNCHVEDGDGKSGDASRVHRDDAGYKAAFHHLGHGHVHALFTSRKPGFLAAITANAIHSELSRPEYTTPLLRAWIPAITATLRAEGLLRPLFGLRCKCGLITATIAQIDAIVTRGVQDGSLPFRELAVV